MLKRLARLATATLLAGGMVVLSAAVRPPDSAAKPSSGPASSSTSTSTPASSRSSFHRTSSHQAFSDRPVIVRRARGRHRRRRYNPWRVSSFGEPGAFDNPAGEDPIVRQAALEAVGNWNGSVVVVDPNTGRILSIVNQKVALGSAFTPCSTFKPVVALAALKEDIISPETELRTGRRGRMNVTEALAHSNNVFFSKLGLMLGFSRVSQYAHEFGLGEKAGWEIPGEVPGRFPAESPRGGGVGLLSSHGFAMEVTLLQMAAMVSAIANGGTLFELQYPRTPEGVSQFQPRVRRRLDDVAPYIPRVKEGMAAAVLYGTGRFAYDPQLDIYGKTGTCSEAGVRLGWFASYSGQQQPKYVVVVLLRGGRPMYGSHAAGIAGRLYHDLRLKEIEAARANNAGPPAQP